MENNVLDAPASKRNGQFSKESFVSSCSHNKPTWNKMSLSPL
jgi:hypothetical protein